MDQFNVSMTIVMIIGGLFFAYAFRKYWVGIFAKHGKYDILEKLKPGDPIRIYTEHSFSTKTGKVVSNIPTLRKLEFCYYNGIGNETTIYDYSQIIDGFANLNKDVVLRMPIAPPKKSSFRRQNQVLNNPSQNEGGRAPQNNLQK